MAIDVQKLSDVISDIDAQPCDYALFLPEEKPWDENVPCLILNPDDGKQFQDASEAVKQFGLSYALGMQDVQDIVENARNQLPSVNTKELVDALNFYYANDVFIKL